ncbi:hypothetical protein BO82DRAFT_350915 [Aspergillus uvarum CBS 121591]|uniref:Uncharacterized protein n=1 Tax=Aspergillus uvarum CBS 121591 TaxID=1448315 RepID=A0A319CIR7_9EURO|nr:hypothetical protein BO82DRAFT_350915 [Aspergillus uvarum CBS 121591]PYH85596.1 hypothetical protein BO82DRAFT_350915 [Aspergillus uvarum CBS 121591]
MRMGKTPRSVLQRTPQLVSLLIGLSYLLSVFHTGPRLATRLIPVPGGRQHNLPLQDERFIDHDSSKSCETMPVARTLQMQRSDSKGRRYR